MNPIFKNRREGRALYIKGSHLYMSINERLLYSFDGGKSWEEVYRLKSKTFLDKIIYHSHLACRLFRKGIHHFNIQLDVYGVLFDKKVTVFSNGKLLREKSFKGSRPLSFENIAGEFIFGEYRSNPERSTIGIYSICADKDLYKKSEMSGIRHIHGIYSDPYSQAIWITTGDNDDEAAIYSTIDNFKTIKKILWGSQQTRTIKLLFTQDFIYFGSDAPNEINYLYRIQRSDHKIERLQQVGSSVFHGCKVGDWLFFSTAIEPSRINKTKYAEVWASPDGVSWKLLFTFKKDLLPMRYFQYGQVFFPIGSGDNKYLWISPFATQYNNKTFQISLDLIKERFYS